MFIIWPSIWAICIPPVLCPSESNIPTPWAMMLLRWVEAIC